MAKNLRNSSTGNFLCRKHFTSDSDNFSFISTLSSAKTYQKVGRLCVCKMEWPPKGLWSVCVTLYMALGPLVFKPLSATQRKLKTTVNRALITLTENTARVRQFIYSVIRDILFKHAKLFPRTRAIPMLLQYF